MENADEGKRYMYQLIFTFNTPQKNLFKCLYVLMPDAGGYGCSFVAKLS